MHTRSVVAAGAGVAGAGAARLLDVHGWLPFVHESAAVRGGLGASGTAAWLAFAGLLAAAARRRPLVAGAAAVVVAGAPELLVRHDPGAMFEPGALMGALTQWLLLLLVIAVATAIDAQARTGPVSATPCIAVLARVVVQPDDVVRTQHRSHTSLSRAPPGRSLLTSV